MSGGDLEVYDKAAWHTGGSWPEGLPESQACVHGGMVLGWILDRGLESARLRADFPELVRDFRARRKTGPEIYALAGGVLASDMLGDEANAFAREYLDPDRGAFLSEYVALLASELPSAYHVEDTWTNYDRLRAHLDERFDAWARRHGGQR
jgi:hypothetical protein